MIRVLILISILLTAGIQTQQVVVTSPKEGSTFTDNEFVTIEWVEIPDVDRVRLELWDNNIYVQHITETSNDGRYRWNVGNGNFRSNTFRIRVISSIDDTVYGFSPIFGINIEDVDYNNTIGQNSSVFSSILLLVFMLSFMVFVVITILVRPRYKRVRKLVGKIVKKFGVEVEEQQETNTKFIAMRKKQFKKLRKKWKVDSL